MLVTLEDHSVLEGQQKQKLEEEEEEEIVFELFVAIELIMTKKQTQTKENKKK